MALSKEYHFSIWYCCLNKLNDSHLHNKIFSNKEKRAYENVLFVNLFTATIIVISTMTDYKSERYNFINIKTLSSII